MLRFVEKKSFLFGNSHSTSEDVLTTLLTKILLSVCDVIGLTVIFKFQNVISVINIDNKL